MSEFEIAGGHRPPLQFGLRLYGDRWHRREVHERRVEPQPYRHHRICAVELEASNHWRQIGEHLVNKPRDVLTRWKVLQRRRHNLAEIIHHLKMDVKRRRVRISNRDPGLEATGGL